MYSVINIYLDGESNSNKTKIEHLQELFHLVHFSSKVHGSTRHASTLATNKSQQHWRLTNKQQHKNCLCSFISKVLNVLTRMGSHLNRVGSSLNLGSSDGSRLNLG